MSLSAIGAGLAGMQRYQSALDVSASRIANMNNWTADGSDPTGDIVNQVVDKVGFQASAQVIKTADDVLGTLIDVRA
ncbi:hypothetical protein [Chitinimonas sp.]|uniref:hypothetical protein n=1 Tax=Chitinimonas sp. TaxID=1934313 RepID=UPI002F9445B8